MDTGYIKLHRPILTWEWYTDPPVFKLFLHFLLRANISGQKWRGQEIKSGELVTSYKHLAKETGLSLMQVRTAINKLKSTQEITQRITRQYSIISINNWGLYQSNQHDYQHTDNTRITPIEEGKEGREYNTHTSVCVKNQKISSSDLEVLADYARRNGARRVKPYVAALIKSGGHIEILDSARKRKKAALREEETSLPPEPCTPEEEKIGRELLRNAVNGIRSGLCKNQ